MAVQLYLDCYSSSVSIQNWYCRYVLCDFTDQQNTVKCRKVKQMVETEQKIYMYYFPEQVSKLQ